MAAPPAKRVKTSDDSGLEYYLYTAGRTQPVDAENGFLIESCWILLSMFEGIILPHGSGTYTSPLQRVTDQAKLLEVSQVLASLTAVSRALRWYTADATPLELEQSPVTVLISDVTLESTLKTTEEELTAHQVHRRLRSELKTAETLIKQGNATICLNQFSTWADIQRLMVEADADSQPDPQPQGVPERRDGASPASPVAPVVAAARSSPPTPPQLPAQVVTHTTALQHRAALPAAPTTPPARLPTAGQPAPVKRPPILQSRPGQSNTSHSPPGGQPAATSALSYVPRASSATAALPHHGGGHGPQLLVPATPAVSSRSPVSSPPSSSTPPQQARMASPPTGQQPVVPRAGPPQANNTAAPRPSAPPRIRPASALLPAPQAVPPTGRPPPSKVATVSAPSANPVPKASPAGPAKGHPKKSTLPTDIKPTASLPFTILLATKSKGVDDGTPVIEKFWEAINSQTQFAWAVSFVSHQPPEDASSPKPATTATNKKGVPKPSFAVKEKQKKGTDYEHEELLFTTFQSLEPKGLCFTWGGSVVWYLKFSSNDAERAETWRRLKELFERTDNKKVQWNCRSQLRFLLQERINVPDTTLLDPQIAMWLIDPDDEVSSLDVIFAREGLGMSKMAYREAKKKLSARAYFQPGPVVPETKTNEMYEEVDYAAWKVYQSWMLQLHLEQGKLDDPLYPRLKSILFDIEMPILSILSRMEFFGIGFEDSTVEKLSVGLKAKMAWLKEQIEAKAGRKVDFDQHTDVEAMLFDEQRLPSTMMTKSGESISKKALAPLKEKYELARWLAEYRKLSHTSTAYLNLPSFTFFGMRRICASFRQPENPTGRISSENPNLQSIAKRFSYKALKLHESKSSASSASDSSSDSLRETPVWVNIRDAFVATDKMVLVSIDYSQLELRVLAHLSRDPRLEQLMASNKDLCEMCAKEWFRSEGQRDHPACPPITEEERLKAKVVVYAIINGQGAAATGEKLGISFAEAKEMKEQLVGHIPGVVAWQSKALEEVKRQGFSFTYEGRRRSYKDLTSTNYRTKSAAERAVKNSITQGSAADIAKKSMIKTDRYLRSLNNQSRLLIHLHDELVFETPIETVEVVASEVRRLMETTDTLRVPLVAKVQVGFAWGSMCPLDEFLSRQRTATAAANAAPATLNTSTSLSSGSS